MSLDAAVDAPCLGFSACVLAFSFSVLLAAFNASLLHVAVHRGVAEALTSVALHDFGAVRRFPDHSVRGDSEESGLHHCIHGGLVPSDFEHVKASWSAVVLSLAAAQHLCHSNVVAGGEFDFFCDLRGCVGTVDILQDASYCGHGPSGVCVSLQVHLLDDLDFPLVSLGGGWCQRVRCFTGDCRELDFLSPQSGDQSLWQNSPHRIIGVEFFAAELVAAAELVVPVVVAVAAVFAVFAFFAGGPVVPGPCCDVPGPFLSYL